MGHDFGVAGSYGSSIVKGSQTERLCMDIFISVHLATCNI